MTDKLDALDRLIEAVEAGALDSVWHGCSALRGHWSYTTGLDAEQRTLAWRAHHGSFDAALALHETLLPGWRWEVAASMFGCDAMVWDRETPERCLATTPARAWLLAILRAYRSTQGDAG